MAYPTLSDDGFSITLDLHGAQAEYALQLARRTVAEASRRGRTSVRIIHGSSTSGGTRPGGSIRERLHTALDQGQLGSGVESTFRAEDFLILSLDVTAAPDTRRITLLDVSP